MPKKDNSDNVMISELGTWNVAARFAEEKVMKPLVKCDIYEDIARFGHDSLLDELENLDQIPIALLKMKGLSRLLNELLKISKNTMFSMKKSGTKEALTKIMDNLVLIKKKLPDAYKKDYNAISREEELVLTNLFPLLVEKTSDLKMALNTPLNKNHLIFTDKEEFDPVAFKDRFKKRMIDKG